MSICEKYGSLKENILKISPQSRGFRFEKLIHQLLDKEKLDPRTGYKPKGEQVDGSFFWSGQTFLVEAKWTKDPIPASAIYSFQGKVNGKFHTTSGVFLSFAGYSDDAVPALVTGKPLNIILFDENDLEHIFCKKASFLDVLQFKLREAGDTGSLLSPYHIPETIKEASESDIEDARNSKLRDIEVEDIIIFVEGENDIEPINKIINEIPNDFNFKYKFIPLGGINRVFDIATILNQYDHRKNLKGVIVFLDEDVKTYLGVSKLQKAKKKIDESAVYIDSKFVYVSDFDNKIINAEKLAPSQIDGLNSYMTALSFLNGIYALYNRDDPFDFSSYGKIEPVLSKGTLNPDQGVIQFWDDDYDMPFAINTIDSLVEFIDDKIVSGIINDLPVSVIKEIDMLDYSTDVREWLYYNYKDELLLLGWDINEL